VGIDIRIRLDLSEMQKRMIRWAVVGGAVIGALGLGIAVAGGPLHSWNPNDTLTAADLNGNFSNLQAEISNVVSTLQAPDGGSPGGLLAAEYYVEESADTITAGTATWVTLSGTSLSFTASAAGSMFVEANGTASGYNSSATSGVTRCSFRLVVDAAASGDATYGDIQVTPALASSGLAETVQWMITHRFLIAAGPHTLSVQMAKPDTAYSTNIQCETANTHLHVLVR
jgi:hypothetical protein